MEIDEFRETKENRNIEEMNELEYFQLLYSDEIIDLLVEGSNEYYIKSLIDTYGRDYKKIILSKEGPSSYPYLYITRGISREDILAYVGIRIYMGIHKLPSIRHYWNTGTLYHLKINRIMPINYFCLLSKVLHFPEKEKEKKKGKEYESSTKENDSTFEIESSLESNTLFPLFLLPGHYL